MIGERFRKLQLDQGDIDSLKHGLAYTIQRLMLDHARRDHKPLGTLVICSAPPSFYATFEIDGTAYEEKRLLRGMGMYAQIHADNVEIAWRSFLQSFEQELKTILEETLRVTAISSAPITATSPLVVGQYHIRLKPLSRP